MATASLTADLHIDRSKLLCPCCTQPYLGPRKTKAITDYEAERGFGFLEKMGWTPAKLLAECDVFFDFAAPGMNAWLRQRMQADQLKASTPS